MPLKDRCLKYGKNFGHTPFCALPLQTRRRNRVSVCIFCAAEKLSTGCGKPVGHFFEAGTGLCKKNYFNSFFNMNINNKFVQSENQSQVQTAEQMAELIEASETMPTEQEAAQAAFMKEVMARRLSLETPYPPEECLLSIDGIPFFARGDINALKAKQKQGKTTALSIMVAAMLCGQWGRLKSLNEKGKIVFIDTEQKPQDSQMVYRRMVKMAGMPELDDYDRLQVYTLRTMDTDQMLQATKCIIEQERPDVVIIDGIVDFIHNFNEVEESQQIIKELSIMASGSDDGRNICIVAVLHENKANDDKNMRGHLGTLLSQKASIVLECVKHSDVFTVRCSDSRHAPVPEWSFQYDREGRVVDADQLRTERLEAEREIRQQRNEQRQRELKDEKVEKLLDIIKRAGGRILRSELRDKYMKAMQVKKTAANCLIKELIGTMIFQCGEFITTERPLDGQLSFEQSDD